MGPQAFGRVAVNRMSYALFTDAVIIVTCFLLMKMLLSPSRYYNVFGVKSLNCPLQIVRFFGGAVDIERIYGKRVCSIYLHICCYYSHLGTYYFEGMYSTEQWISHLDENVFLFALEYPGLTSKL